MRILILSTFTLTLGACNGADEISTPAATNPTVTEEVAETSVVEADPEVTYELKMAEGIFYSAYDSVCPTDEKPGQMCGWVQFEGQSPFPLANLPYRVLEVEPGDQAVLLIANDEHGTMLAAKVVPATE